MFAVNQKINFIQRKKIIEFISLGLFFYLLSLIFSNQIYSQQKIIMPSKSHIAIFTIDGAISPATTDYLIRSIDQSKALGAVAIVLRLDTPGGLDAATRDIIKAILASSIPVITFVHPAGARATSAGAYILYASHIAAMTPSTTLGAATPVNIRVPTLPLKPTSPRSPASPKSTPSNDSPIQNNNGSDISQNKEFKQQTIMERKMLNDAVAFIRGLAKRHARNEEWAEKAVRQAVTLTASEALQKKVIDIIADDISDLLAQANKRLVQMETTTKVINTEDLDIVYYDPDWRNKLLAIITNPQIAYILLMFGIYGLVLEGYNPGAFVPGVVGGICLITAFYALQVLPVNYAGLALIILGVLLIIAESISPSFGILGIGGVVAITLGSVMLIDRDMPSMQISYKLIGSFAVISSAVVLVILMAVGRSLRMKRIPINKAMVGKIGLVESFIKGRGIIHIEGERWQVTSRHKLHPNQKVRVVSETGLLLNVEPLNIESKDIEARDVKTTISKL